MSFYKDKMGRYRTQSLFKEWYKSDTFNATYPPVFTLKEHDVADREGNMLPSMRQLFLSYNDPTGYAFAKEVLGSYDHWKKLVELKWFQEELAVWLDELEVKLRSEGLKVIVETAKKDTAQAYNASKFLVDKGWVSSKGRPTKAQITKAAAQEAEVKDRVSGDLERLRVIK